MPSLTATDQSPMSAPLTKCPICEQQVGRDAEELQRHVNDHLDAGEDELSRNVALEMSNGDTTREAPKSCITNNVSEPDEIGELIGPTERTTLEVEKNDATLAGALADCPQVLPSEIHISPSVQSSPTNDSDEIGENSESIGPAERMMLEMEKSDAALAAALSGSPQVNPAGVYVSPSLRGSLSDSAERYYPNALRLVLPLYDTRELLLRKKCHMCTKLDLFCSNIAGLGWDCGYRNIQMMFSALLRSPETGAELRAAGITEVPSIPEIAGRIESAWKSGFDPEGAKNFGGTLVDKDVWIGATEAFVLFRSINMNATIMDFETPTALQKKALFEWIFMHFDEACKGRNCSLHRKSRLTSGRTATLVSPLFCQWQGHSVTIIGAEKTRTGDIILVILDPSRGFYTSLMGGASLRFLRRDINHPQFSHPRFQFVSVLPKRGSNDLSSSPSNAAPNDVTAVSNRQVRRGMLGRFRLGGPS